jgi:hypothetical protein
MVTRRDQGAKTEGGPGRYQLAQVLLPCLLLDQVADHGHPLSYGGCFLCALSMWHSMQAFFGLSL